MLVIYVGTCIIQLLTWASVGKMNLGISIRYFIPLLALIPILGLSDLFKFKFYDGKKLDNCIIILIISFLSLLILSFIAIFY